VTAASTLFVRVTFVTRGAPLPLPCSY
jgi:hypothetical protein